MRRVNLVEFPDLLFYAESIGISWNKAHEVLVNDEIPPMYECNSREYYLSDLNQYGYSEDTIKIIKGFMEKNNVTEFTLIND
jgi:hypothetical protein